MYKSQKFRDTKRAYGEKPSVWATVIDLFFLLKQIQSSKFLPFSQFFDEKILNPFLLS